MSRGNDFYTRVGFLQVRAWKTPFTDFSGQVLKRTQNGDLEMYGLFKHASKRRRFENESQGKTERTPIWDAGEIF